jgi:hypothetical protein
MAALPAGLRISSATATCRNANGVGVRSRIDKLHDFLFENGPAPESNLSPQEEAELDKLCDEAMECWEDICRSRNA